MMVDSHAARAATLVTLRECLVTLDEAGEALVAAHLQIAVDLLELSLDQSAG